LRWVWVVAIVGVLACRTNSGPDEDKTAADDREVASPTAATIGVEAASLGVSSDGADQTLSFALSYKFVVFDESGVSVSEVDGVLMPFEDGDVDVEYADDARCEVRWVVAAASAVSVPLVLDQGGSLQTTDPNHTRMSSAEAFLGSLSAEDESVLITFADPNPCASFPVSLWGGGFATDHTTWFDTLDGLIGCEGGDRPLFDAAASAVDMANERGTRDGRAAVLFTDGADTVSRLTEQEVIDLARAANVPIFPIGVSDSVDQRALSHMALATGGAYFFGEDMGPTISAFRGMHQLLTGAYWRMDCTQSMMVTVATDAELAWVMTQIRVDHGDHRMYIPMYIGF
jgi:hypothetical protein